MFSQPLLASVVKVLLVGGVMAGGAGGFYLVAENRSSSGGRDLLVAATSTAAAGALTPVASTTAASPPAATAVATKPPGTATPQPPLTDTGYKAPDGSPLYKECIGHDPLALANGTPLANAPTLPLPPPPYPTAGAFQPLPSPPAEQNPNPRPPVKDLPAFDPAAVAPSDATAWLVDSTPCLGGLRIARPPGFDAVSPLVVTLYQTGAAIMYTTADRSVKVDMTYGYTLDDLLTRRKNNSAGNGTYFLAHNVPVTVGGAEGIMDVSSEIIESTQRYIVVSYLISPRPHWFLSYVGFFYQPYSEKTFANFYGMVNSTRFAP